MINKLTRTNAVIIVYQALSDEGKLQTKRLTLNVMSSQATDDDFYDVGRAAGNMLAYAPKEILKSNLVLLTEV